MSGDQVHRVEAPAGAGAHRAVRALGRAHGTRSVHRHHAGRPGVQGGRRPRHRRRLRRYSQVFARTWIETDAATSITRASARGDRRARRPARRRRLLHRHVLRQSRFFQPHNGERIDAIRDAIARDHAGTPLEPILLTSLLLAADRVDSTTGVQMAYVKEWAPRSYKPLRLRGPAPARRTGAGAARRRRRSSPASSVTSTSPTSTRRTTSTATSRTTTCGRRSWRGIGPSTTAWPASASTPATTRPRACSTASARCPTRCAARSPAIDADVVIVSYNDEAWVTLDELRDMCASARRRRRARVRLAALRRRPDRHPQPGRREGRHRVAHPQPGVRGDRRRPGDGAGMVTPFADAVAS